MVERARASQTAQRLIVGPSWGALGCRLDALRKHNAAIARRCSDCTLVILGYVLVSSSRFSREDSPSIAVPHLVGAMGARA
jgi:hypothetical protein